MPTRTLPQPILGGGNGQQRGYAMDLRSTMTGGNTQQQQQQQQQQQRQYGETQVTGPGTSNLPALLRAIEMAREHAGMESNAPSDQTAETP
jgi:hypothetical protein